MAITVIQTQATLLDGGEITASAGTDRLAIYGAGARCTVATQPAITAAAIGSQAFAETAFAINTNSGFLPSFILTVLDADIPAGEQTVDITWSTTMATEGLGGWLLLGGVDQVTPVRDQDEVASNAATVYACPSALDVDVGDCVVCVLEVGTNTGPITLPSGYTAVHNTVPGNAMATALVYKLITEAGTEQPQFEIPSSARGSAVFVVFRAAGGSTAPTIESVSDATLAHGQTGVVLTGTNFSASGNTVLISPTDDVNDVNAVEQTISAEGTTEITLGALDLDSFDFGNLYVFVINSSDESNETGEIVSRVVATATLDFTGSNKFVDEAGDAQASVEDLTLYVWRSPRPPSSVGTPDQIITGVDLDASGELTQSIDVGSLEPDDTVFGMLFAADGTDLYWAGEVTPTYE